MEQKIHSIAKELAKTNIAFCCLQEVRWRDVGAKVVKINTDEMFEFPWVGYKKKRQTGVGMLLTYYLH